MATSIDSLPMEGGNPSAPPIQMTIQEITSFQGQEGGGTQGQQPIPNQLQSQTIQKGKGELQTPAYNPDEFNPKPQHGNELPPELQGMDTQQDNPPMNSFLQTLNQEINQSNGQQAGHLNNRDIPMNTASASIHQDPSIQTNYIPQHSSSSPSSSSSKQDYIKEQMTLDDMYKKRMEEEKRKYQDIEMYEELQVPILIALLFFVFQLPFVHQHLVQYLPVLFTQDGSMNFYGYVFKASIFGGLYYALHKFLHYLSSL